MTDDEEQFDLSAMFADDADDGGLSLDRLSETYAEALGNRPVPFQEETPPESDEEAPDDESTAEAISRLADEAEADDPCELSPTTILEAILFVGHASNDKLTAEKAASVMRGVQADEIDDLVSQLNRKYESEGCPYEITAVGGTYRMALRDEFRPLREKFYGKVREAKLSQPAIDVLSLVAYNQGATREEVDDMRNKPSGPILTQLVRRRLLRVQPDPEDKRLKRYTTTERFLQLFGLTSLDDLPQPQSLDD
ncbi:SMC-Scp complex subunit ScpB [Bremerella sp. P1]|uniref:SMC-Scp complex subunit ScpB n=1 Tax=Bremerella sp. P1 TaxID=3026424 RepID=UPI002367BB14|nr:SMC-Scp complex subunit ScpB [Bremerella sp. P1]WDI45041.1 SMC-Scp complex subunit ScpB [Bremerella sp. P1]